MTAPDGESATFALVQRSPGVGLSASIALAIVTIESVAAAFGTGGIVFHAWRIDAITTSTWIAAAVLSCVGLITYRTGRVLERLVSAGTVSTRTDLAATYSCAALHLAFGVWLGWFTAVDPVDAVSNVVVIAVAIASIATAGVLITSGRAGRLPTDDELSADAQAFKTRLDDGRQTRKRAKAGKSAV